MEKEVIFVICENVNDAKDVFDEQREIYTMSGYKVVSQKLILNSEMVLNLVEKEKDYTCTIKWLSPYDPECFEKISEDFNYIDMIYVDMLSGTIDFIQELVKLVGKEKVFLRTMMHPTNGFSVCELASILNKINIVYGNLELQTAFTYEGYVELDIDEIRGIVNLITVSESEEER